MLWHCLPLDERQITHLICTRLKYDLSDFFRGCFGAFYIRKTTGRRPKTPPKKSYRSYFRRAQIRWVIWHSSSHLSHPKWCYDSWTFGLHATIWEQVKRGGLPNQEPSHFSRTGPGCVPDPFGNVLVGHLKGPRKKKRINWENPHKEGKNPKESGKSQQRKQQRRTNRHGTIQIGRDSRLKPPGSTGPWAMQLLTLREDFRVFCSVFPEIATILNFGCCQRTTARKTPANFNTEMFVSKVGQPMSNSWLTSSQPDFVQALARS